LHLHQVKHLHWNDPMVTLHYSSCMNFEYKYILTSSSVMVTHEIWKWCDFGGFLKEFYADTHAIWTAILFKSTVDNMLGCLLLYFVYPCIGVVHGTAVAWIKYEYYSDIVEWIYEKVFILKTYLKNIFIICYVSVSLHRTTSYSSQPGIIFPTVDSLYRIFVFVTSNSIFVLIKLRSFWFGLQQKEVSKWFSNIYLKSIKLIF
jgi:hypothetical protein